MAVAVCYFSSWNMQPKPILNDTLGQQCLPCRMLGRIKEGDARRGLGPGREVPSPSISLSNLVVRHECTGGSLGPFLSDPLGPPGREVGEYMFMPVPEAEPLCARPTAGWRIREHKWQKRLWRVESLSTRKPCGVMSRRPGQGVGDLLWDLG